MSASGPPSTLASGIVAEHIVLAITPRRALHLGLLLVKLSLAEMGLPSAPVFTSLDTERLCALIEGCSEPGTSTPGSMTPPTDGAGSETTDSG